MIKYLLEHWWDVPQAIAVILASIVAIYGVNNWRREARGKRKLDLAEETLSLFYEVKDVISDIRSPYGYQHEGESRQKDEREPPEKTAALNRAYALRERYMKHVETFGKLRALRYRFMAVFGKETAQPFDKLGEILGELNMAMIMLGDLWYQRDIDYRVRTKDEAQRLQDDIRKYEAIFWEGPPPNLISKKVDEMISEIEKVCAPILSKA